MASTTDAVGGRRGEVLVVPFRTEWGAARKGLYAFSGNRLTLKTEPLPAAGTMVTGILVWERATSEETRLHRTAIGLAWSVPDLRC